MHVHAHLDLQPFQEVTALRLIQPHVTTPVPFVLDAVGEYFIMTALRGEPLGTVFSEMQPDDRLQLSYSAKGQYLL
jgi:hypothetical protein